MRVGLLIYGGLDTVSGGYLYDRKLVEYLRVQGDEVQIISLPWRNYAAHLGDNFSGALLQHLVNLDVDILLQDELNHPSLFLLNQRLKSRVSYPIISIVHHLRASERHPFWIKWFYRLVERRYLNSVDGFVFNSQTTRQVVEAVIGERKPAIVAYPAGDRLGGGISEDQIRQRVFAPGPLQILFLGNLIPRKGLHILIEALERLPKDTWRLTVIGGYDSSDKYVKNIYLRIAKQSLGANIQFQGSIADELLPEQFGNRHLLVVPSTYEGFGIVYLEGMGYGLLAIGTTAGAAHEIIQPGESGFLIEPEDSVGLAEILRNLHTDRQHLFELSCVAQKRFNQFPGWTQATLQIRTYLLSRLSSQAA